MIKCIDKYDNGKEYITTDIKGFPIAFIKDGGRRVGKIQYDHKRKVWNVWKLFGRKYVILKIFHNSDYMNAIEDFLDYEVCKKEALDYFEGSRTLEMFGKREAYLAKVKRELENAK